MVINIENLSKILNRYKNQAINYFELSNSGAVMFKIMFDGRYLILAYLLAKLYKWIGGLADREDASERELIELPFITSSDIDYEVSRLINDDLIKRTEKGYCLNFMRLDEIFQLLDEYVAAQRRP
jgi:hypothetical protein